MRIMKKNERKEKFMQMEKLMKKVMLANILLLKIIDKKHQKKNLIANLLGCYQGYDADYETCRIQTFISEFRNKNIKDLEDEIKKKIKILIHKLNQRVFKIDCQKVCYF